MIGRAITDHSSPAHVVVGANGVAVAPGPEMPASFGAPARAGLGNASALGAFAAFGAALLCLAFSPKANSLTFTPKFAVVLLFAAVGLVPLARLVRAGSRLRWPARGAVAFLAVALLSALVSPSPNLGIFGLYLWGTGWLLWLGAAGAFAIGASLGPNDRRWLFAGLLAGALGSALVAIYQMARNLPTPGLGLYDGTQADAFLGNPIHLEALLLGALALVLGRACRNPLRWAVVVLLLSVGLEFTFERYAFPILAALALYALYSYGVRRGGAFTLLVGVGYAIAYLGGGSGLGSRVTSGTQETTYGLRFRVWLQSAHYVLHHPLLGAGPGQLRTAMDSSASLSFFQNVLAGRVLTDGHDIFVEVAVTTGLLGLACFLIWTVGAVRKAPRCSFLGFALALFAVELVEPINVAILPLAFLALGAATAVRLHPAAPGVEMGGELAHGQRAHDDDSSAGKRAPSGRLYSRITTLVALVAALFLGVTMVAGDFYLFRATHFGLGQPFNVASARDADRLLRYWPDSALVVAQIDAFDSLRGVSADPAVLADSRRWTAVAVSRDPRNPALWTLLAGADVEIKQYALARAEYVRALSCDRWYTQAFQGLGRVAGIEGNWNEAVRWYRLAVSTAGKDKSLATSLRQLLSDAEHHAHLGAG